MNDTKDELIAVRCQIGERAAFDELIERWHLPLWKYVRRVTGDDDSASETVQDVWLRVLRGIPHLRQQSRLRAWLFGIARRALMDRLRDKYSLPVLASFDIIDVADDPPFSPPEDIWLLNDELMRLPVTEREILTLFYLEELSLGEVSEVLEIPVGTVKSRLHRARQMLREQLGPKGMNT